MRLQITMVTAAGNWLAGQIQLFIICNATHTAMHSHCNAQSELESMADSYFLQWVESCLGFFTQDCVLRICCGGACIVSFQTAQSSDAICDLQSDVGRLHIGLAGRFHARLSSLVYFVGDSLKRNRMQVSWPFTS